MKTKLIIIIAIFLASCSGRYHLKRAKYHILKAESKGLEWQSDTVFHEVPIFLPETRLDSIIVTVPGDTVVLIKDRLEVKYVRLKGDTIFIEAACLPDTVYRKEPVFITNEITCPACKIPFWVWIVITALSLGVVAALLKR